MMQGLAQSAQGLARSVPLTISFDVCCEAQTLECRACKLNVEPSVLETCCAPENLRDPACADLDILRLTLEGALHDYSQDPLPLRYEWDAIGSCIENNYPPAECCSSSAPEECS